MKAKILSILAVSAIIAVVVLNVNLSKNNYISTLSLSISDIEANASCESVGWKGNDGNCVKNSSGVFFCKEDDWLSITDCLQ